MRIRACRDLRRSELIGGRMFRHGAPGEAAPRVRIGAVPAPETRLERRREPPGRVRGGRSGNPATALSGPETGAQVLNRPVPGVGAARKRLPEPLKGPESAGEGARGARAFPVPEPPQRRSGGLWDGPAGASTGCQPRRSDPDRCRRRGPSDNPAQGAWRGRAASRPRRPVEAGLDDPPAPLPGTSPGFPDQAPRSSVFVSGDPNIRPDDPPPPPVPASMPADPGAGASAR